MQEVFEKIIEKLNEVCKSEITIHGGRCNGKTLALGYAKGIEKAIEIVKKEAEEYNNGWIPCSERLPEERELVIVWFEYFRYGEYNRLFQTMGISYMFDGKFSNFVNGSSGWDQLRFIAWHPLPKPYTKGE